MSKNWHKLIVAYKRTFNIGQYNYTKKAFGSMNMWFHVSTNYSDYVHTGPDPCGHDINLNSFKTGVALKFVIILLNLLKTNHRKSGESKAGFPIARNISLSKYSACFLLNFKH